MKGSLHTCNVGGLRKIDFPATLEVNELNPVKVEQTKLTEAR